MRRRALGCLLLLAAACAPSTPERPGPAAGEPGASRLHRFRVRSTAAPAEVRHDLSLKQISRLPGAAGSGLKTQGLTTIKHELATRTRFSTATGDKKGVYAWFDDVILEVRISSIVIHIPREYARGSCEFEIVLEHERGHGQAAREQAALLARRLEGALSGAEDIPTRFDPVVSHDIAAAAERLKTVLAKFVDPHYERFEKEHTAAQMKLDRPDPYDAVYRKCTGWK
ncbi:MAG: hypothetical protein Q8T11_03220 [Elusimicrobiota bacterium]|nr:hypothetical protein [Elusimicrobiota bacterium]